MNVWVLTGDKLETAINIGMACNLLESSMERKGNLLRIDGTNAEKVASQIDDFVAHIRWLKEVDQSESPCGLVLTSEAYALIMNAPKETLNRFLWIATRCKSVVACRMQPNQKAMIVNLVKTTQKVVTLAIGDGANDEQMIREADVGVGIRGVEGTTAVRASDYAISQFYFLHRLLFVHGRLNYRRIAILIAYIFYKNILITFVPLWFGMFSGFSGQALFLTWAYQAYNIIYTAFPILVFATLDRDISFRELEHDPKIYSKSQHGELFNVVTFWKWIILGLLQSVAMCLIPMACYQDVAMDNTGQSFGMWEVGIVMYTVIVLVCNLKLALLSQSWTWLHHLSIWGSIFVYFISMLIFGASSAFSNAGADYTGAVTKLFGTPRYWLTTIITVIISLYIDYLIFALDELNIAKQLLPTRWHKWLLTTFPTSLPPDPNYFPASLPEPKRLQGGHQEEKKQRAYTHERTHTGYAFDNPVMLFRDGTTPRQSAGSSFMGSPSRSTFGAS